MWREYSFVSIISVLINIILNSTGLGDETFCVESQLFLIEDDVSLVSGKKLANKWRAIRDNYVRYLKQMKLNQNKKYKYAKRLSTFLVIRNNDADDDSSDDERIAKRTREFSFDDDYLDTKRQKVNASPLFVEKEEPLSSEEIELEIATPPPPPTPEPLFPNLKSTDSSDEDRCFFDSLMPACKTLDLDQKLHFRSQVINLLRHIRKGNDRITLDSVNGVFINEN